MRRWHLIFSWCLEGAVPKFSLKDWLAGWNAGLLFFFFLLGLYKITAVALLRKNRTNENSFVSLIYLNHHAVIWGKYCYFMTLATHTVLKINALRDRTNALKSYFGEILKGWHLNHIYNLCLLKDRILRATGASIHIFTDWVMCESCHEPGTFLDNDNKYAVLISNLV